MCVFPFAGGRSGIREEPQEEEEEEPQCLGGPKGWNNKGREEGSNERVVDGMDGSPEPLSIIRLHLSLKRLLLSPSPVARKRGGGVGMVTLWSKVGGGAMQMRCWHITEQVGVFSFPLLCC